MTAPVQRLLSGFPRALREAGLAIDPARARDFLTAVTRIPLRDLSDLARAGRVTLTSSPADFPLFDAVFKAWFAQDPVLVIEPPDGPEDDALLPRPKAEPKASPELLPGEAKGLDAAAEDIISKKTFAQPRPEDEALHAAIRRTALPVQMGRRWRPAVRGPKIDLARTARQARRTFGDTIRLTWMARPEQPRKLLLLIDISGSMKAHSEAYLRAAHALVQRGTAIDVFCFSTRLTRITASLRHRDAGEALRRLADLVFDFDGGTRIGEALQAFLSASRHAAMVRGAVTLVLSDGLERGDTAAMVTSIERIARLSHRLIWLTPLASDPRYVPATRAMAAVVLVLDCLAPASSLASIQASLLHLAGLSRSPRGQALRLYFQGKSSS